MEYIYIRAWGNFMGSYGYYIENEIEKAKRENAPADAIYKGHDGTWATFSGIGSENTKRIVAELAEAIKNDK